MSGGIPAITGHELIRLLKRDGWEEDGRRTHGVAMKKLDDDGILRITTIPTHAGSLPIKTLASILGSKQTNIGMDGFKRLIRK
jgi:predicted RNA binding protein YcfA (HicA-like mRNA interferase family)